jgi:hypothetical protein
MQDAYKGIEMRELHVAAAAMLFTLAACNDAPKPAAQEATTAQAQDPAGEPVAQAELTARAAAGKGDTAAYYTALPLKEFMPHVMQYAGDGIWKRQGYIVDEKGERSLFPKNDQEWEDAESASLALAEMTNVLLIPGRRVPEAGWDNAVAGVRAVALKAAQAAEKKDPDAFFAAGGELDEACDACHLKYDPTMKQ